MSNEVSRQKQLFDAALEHEASVREAWLRRACGDDQAAFAAVWELLKAHEAAGSFLATPESLVQRQLGIAGPRVSEPATEQPGQQVGGYRLLEQLGEGGFGTVWMAQQEQPVRRLVALKVLKAGMDSAQVVARFEQERQALALMQHQNVAQVFDAGVTAAGRPFFVMELVKGVPVTEYCMRERLTVAARLQLFVQVCRAVQHAHGKGLIHRDIKPRNVLVATHDGRPLAKVIDFGIAKATGARLVERTLFTEHRAMVGTLEYMSPEQAEGQLDIDTRADVYSLGALLYELLTGGTPFESRKLLDAGLAEMLRVLREVDPQRPSLRISSQAGAGWAGGAGRAVGAVDAKSLFGALRGDLDWVVMKALEKDRGRRYASADGLAEDVERYLSGDPVLAVPPSFGYRVKKFVRRHRAMVSAVCTALLATTVGAVAVGVSWQASVAERVRAENAEAREGSQREAARFANYSNAVAYAAENAALGSRANALRVLETCEPALRDWEWRYAKASAEDSVRLLVKQPVASGSGPDGVLALFDFVKEKAGPELWVGFESLRLLDTASGHSKQLWRSAGVSNSNPSALQSSLLGQRCVVTQEIVAVLPAATSPIGSAISGEHGVFAGFQRSSGAQIYWHALPKDSRVAFAATAGKVVVVEVDGTVTCRDLGSGEVGWRVALHREPLDLLAAVAGDVVVVLVNGPSKECRLLDLANGQLLRTAPVPAEVASGGAAPEPWDAKFLALTQDSRRVAVVDRNDEWIDPSWAFLVGLDTGEVVRVLRNPIEMVFAGASGLAMGARMLEKFDGVRSQHTHSLELVGQFLPTIQDLERVDASVGLLWPRGTGTELVLGDGDFGPGTVDAPLYKGGTYDICTATWERRTLPRIYAGFARSSLGNKGLCCVEVGPHLIVLANRPHDVFPPRPLGAELPVAALGVWHGRPAAFYAAGVMTLDAERAERLPARSGPDSLSEVSVSSSGEFVGLVELDRVRVVRADGGDGELVASISGTARAIAVTSTGQHAIVVVQDPSGVEALRVFARREDSAPIAQLPLPGDTDSKHFITASADRLALASADQPLRLFELPSLAEVPCGPGVAQPASCVQFSPNGALLAVGRPDGHVLVLRRDGGVLAVIATHRGEVRALAWSADGARLFAAGADGFVRLLHPERGTELLNLGDNSIPGQPGVRAFDGLPCCLFATPDGERLFCGYTDGAVRVWDTVPWLERVARRQQAEADAKARAPK